MAVDVDTEEGRALVNLTRELHNRRFGRVRGSSYSRTVTETKDIRPGLELLMAYRRGDPPLPANVHEGWAPYVRGFVRTGRLNIAALLISSTRNRMPLRDFRTSAADDEQGDIEARRLMLANDLAVRSRDLHDYVLTCGDGYTMTTPPKTGQTYSNITAEDPRQVITDDDPVTGRVRRGLKLFRDDWDSTDFAYLVMPDGQLRVYEKKGTSTIRDAVFRFAASQWTLNEELSSDALSKLGGRHPFEHFRNEDGTGEFEPHLDTLDRINDKIFNEWWISKLQAFRQRAVISDLPDEDEDGEDIDYSDMFTQSPDSMWKVPSESKFWESTPVDLNPIINSIKADLERLAAAVSQSLHTITPDAAQGSAEGASLLREEHLYKIEDRIARVDRHWCETLATGFAYMGDTSRSESALIEAIWGPAERFSLSQRSDAASKLKGILPTEAIWTDVLQYTPKDVPRLRALQGRDLIAAVADAASRGATALPSPADLAAPSPAPQPVLPGGPTPAPVDAAA